MFDITHKIVGTLITLVIILCTYIIQRLISALVRKICLLISQRRRPVQVEIRNSEADIRSAELERQLQAYAKTWMNDCKGFVELISAVFGEPEGRCTAALHEWTYRLGLGRPDLPDKQLLVLILLKENFFGVPLLPPPRATPHEHVPVAN